MGLSDPYSWSQDGVGMKHILNAFSVADLQLSLATLVDIMSHLQSKLIILIIHTLALLNYQHDSTECLIVKRRRG